MSVYQLFVTPPEIDSIIQTLSVRHNLAGVLGIHNKFELYDPKANPSDLLSRIEKEPLLPPHIFLFPKKEEVILVNDISPRAECWIDISVGSLVSYNGSTVLTISTIQAADMGNKYNPASWLKTLLKKHSDLTFGVSAENAKYGGSGIFSDVAYSEGALALFDSGVFWRQFIDGNIDFSPLSTTQSTPRTIR